VPAPEALPIELLDELGDVLLDDELLLGDVLLGEVLLGAVLLLPAVLPVALVSLVLLPVVPDVAPDMSDELLEPIMALVRV